MPSGAHSNGHREPLPPHRNETCPLSHRGQSPHLYRQEQGHENNQSNISVPRALIALLRAN